MMSCVCNVVGAAPVGGVIVGASPALPVTAGNPAADPDTVSSPPRVVIDANAIAATAKTANIFTRVFFGTVLPVIRFRRLV
jgi:hypothetical protein